MTFMGNSNQQSANRTIAASGNTFHNKKRSPSKKKFQYKEVMLKNGCFFRGEEKIGPHGKKKNTGAGELVFPDGSIYMGTIHKGRPHGYGEKVWP